MNKEVFAKISLLILIALAIFLCFVEKLTFQSLISGGVNFNGDKFFVFSIDFLSNSAIPFPLGIFKWLLPTAQFNLNIFYFFIFILLAIFLWYKSKSLNSIFFILIFVVWFVFYIGIHLSFFSAILFFPLVLKTYQTGRTLFFVISFLLFSLLAGPFSFVLFLIIAFYSLLNQRISSDHQVKFLFALFIALIYQTMLPTIDLMEFKPEQKFVPSYVMPYQLVPLFTRYVHTAILDRVELKSILLFSLLWIGVGLYIYFLFSKDKKNALISFVLFLIILLDLIFPETLSNFLLLQSIRRLLPYGYFISYVEVLIVALVFLLTIKGVEKNSLSLSVFYIWLFLLPIYKVEGDMLPVFESRIDIFPYQHLLNKEGDKLFTPSYAVYKRAYKQIELTKKFQGKYKLTKFDYLNIKYLSSSPVKNFKAMFDNDPKTRFSYMRGKQLGDEFLEIIFPKPMPIVGIELFPKHFFTDYPRGVLITGELEDNTYKTLAFIPNWMGPIKFTKKRRLPFFGKASNCKIFFNTDKMVKKIKIRQIKQAKYDWSIAELRFLINKD